MAGAAIGGAAVGGGINALSAIGSAGATYHMQKQAQDWAEKMRRTHFQATTFDLRKAGLNPMLAIQGIKSPAWGASGSSVSPGNVAGGAAAGAEAATNAVTKAKQREVMDEQKELIGEQVRQAFAIAEKTAAEAQSAKYQAGLDGIRFNYYAGTEEGRMALIAKETMGQGVTAAAPGLWHTIKGLKDRPAIMNAVNAIVSELVNNLTRTGRRNITERQIREYMETRGK